MRFHTPFYATAMMALANLIAACEPEIVTVTTEKVVLVCLDKAHTQVEAGQSCPNGEAPTIQYVCAMNGSTVPDAAMCPVWEVFCPEGTYLLTETEKAYKGCVYQETCHEGWAYETSTGTCKKYCAAGETLSADGLRCEIPSTPFQGVVAIGKTIQGVDERPQVTAGARVKLLSLTMSSGNARVRTQGNSYLLVVDNDGSFPTRNWDVRYDEVQGYLTNCTLEFYAGANTTASAPLTLHRTNTGEAAVDVPAMPVFQGEAVYDLWCETKTGLTGPYAAAARLASVTVLDEMTNENPPVAFGDVNFHHGTYAVAHPPTACPAPRVTLASGSPSGAAIPSFGEVLRFAVTNDIACSTLSVRTIQYRIVNSGWYTTVGQLRLTDVYHPQDAISVTSRTEWDQAELAHLTMDAPSGDVIVYPDRTQVFRLEMDTSGANAVQDDTLRVDVTGFCYRDMVTAADHCLDQSNGPLVTGGTLIF